MSTEHNTEISKRINDLFEIEDYESAKKILTKEIEEYPNDHWLLAELAISYYELRDYKTALIYSGKAIKLAPDCPLTMDYHAIILFANEETEKSLEIWSKLLNKDVEDIAFGQCGEGKRFAKSLINDVRFRLGDVHLKLNDKKNALDYYKDHLNNRQRGIYSNFLKKEVEKEIASLEKTK